MSRPPRYLPSLCLLSLVLCAACGGKGADVDGDGFEAWEDCDDRDSRVNPGATEVCDGVDDDCDGNTDGEWASDSVEYYIDYDDDGHGSDAYVERTCERPDGWSTSEDDCDDADPEVYPDASEVCDFLDNDCDGEVDEDALDAVTWYADTDHDGHGDYDTELVSCVQPSGYSPRATDCDDGDAEVHVGATERCNELDDDCDGEVDEDAEDASLWYVDADSDGYGDPTTAEASCDALEGTIDVGEDCDDADATISPDAEEICKNLVDDNCNANDDGCAPNGSWSLAVADAALLGSTSYDSAGAALAPAGDLDGDGDGEIMVGIPGSDLRASGAGAVAVLDGPLAAEEDLDSAMALLTGSDIDDAAGSALSPAGDLDDDGYSDLLVGAPYADVRDDDAGTVYVVDGPVTASTRLSLAGERLKGDAEDVWLGFAVAGVGDLDEDRNPDVALGAPGDDTEGSGAGVAWFVPGPVDSSVYVDTQGIPLYGYGEGAAAGRALAGAGDVDGDGVHDLIVGSPGDEAGGTWAGAAYLVAGPVTEAILLSHDAIALRGVSAGDAAGWSVSGIGDMNDDGYADVAIGAYGADGDATDAGKVYVVLGPADSLGDLSEADATVRGRETRGFAGWSVSGLGDINGDAVPDLVIGARGSDGEATDGGAAYLLYGPLSGSSAADAADAVYFGPGAGDVAGSAVAGANDVDGDGYHDLLVGGPGAYGENASSGAAWLILGSGI